MAIHFSHWPHPSSVSLTVKEKFIPWTEHFPESWILQVRFVEGSEAHSHRISDGRDRPPFS